MYSSERGRERRAERERDAGGKRENPPARGDDGRQRVEGGADDGCELGRWRHGDRRPDAMDGAGSRVGNLHSSVWCSPSVLRRR
ncbi:hypothetical protein U1Q18_008908 [Sarracenia purpurea var. burkii]